MHRALRQRFLGAPLGPLLAERPAWSYAILTPELIGALVTLDAANEWIMHRNLVGGERVDLERESAKRVPLAAHQLLTGGRCEELNGIESDGAVLVRLDGFVAWRARAAPPDPAESLRGALAAVLAR